MILKILLILILLGGLAGISLLTAVLVRSKWHWKLHPADCMIVLGAKVHPDGRMSTTLTLRCRRAAELWKEGWVKAIIVSGGQVTQGVPTEASLMRGYLTAHGVPQECILSEARSVNTRENFAFSKMLMQEHGWRTSMVVTSDYHVQRALWLAKDAQIEACGASAPSPPRFRSRWKARIRECIGWALYWYRKITRT